MDYRNKKAVEELSEIPEEIVSLIINLTNRPEIRIIQEQQVREIRAYAANELDMLADAIVHAKDVDGLSDSTEGVLDMIVSRVRARANDIRNGK